MTTVLTNTDLANHLLNQALQHEQDLKRDLPQLSPEQISIRTANVDFYLQLAARFERER